MDTKEFKFPHQLGNPIITKGPELNTIEDWFAYAENLPTIEEEMNKLVKPNDFRKAIYITHSPPSNIGLDVCYDKGQVGSRAVHEFLAKNQPLLSLHGHIHESPKVSGKWHDKIGETTCIQPGQEHDLIYVVIDLEKMEYERYKVKKNE